MENLQTKENCTIDAKAACDTCSIHGKLACKFDRQTLHGFMAIGFPLAGNGYGLMVLLNGAYNTISIVAMGGVILGGLLSSVTFVVSLMTWFCTKCVNFSCPLNRVPKETVDGYLNMNQEMKEAWESRGYRVSR